VLSTVCLALRPGKESIELGQLHWSTGNYQPLQERALWAGIADAYDQGVIKVRASLISVLGLASNRSFSTNRIVPIQTRTLNPSLTCTSAPHLQQAVGLSNYGPKQLRRVHNYMSARGVPIASLQVQYHLLSRFPETNGTRETCDELGIRLIAYSPLALGRGSLRSGARLMWCAEEPRPRVCMLASP
jgi:pyridoxine 4-dehydrogenase